MLSTIDRGIQTMGKTLDLGRRIELQPMDTHCHNISVGLYLRHTGGVPQVLVHTYADLEGASDRVAFLRQALIDVIGLEPVPDDEQWLCFPCGSMHQRALKRAFLDLCKLPNDAPLAPKDRTAFDKKAGSELTAASLGAGVYEIQSEHDDAPGRKRAAAVARGFAKLCEMDPVEDSEFRVAFPCATSHDALIGALLFRAQNVRAAMQEMQSTAARGVLAAPSQQR